MRSEAQTFRKKINRALKWSILGPQNLGLGGSAPETSHKIMITCNSFGRRHQTQNYCRVNGKVVEQKGK